MEEKKQNEELQSRREFFKKTAKGALPILGISLFGTSLLTACEKETGGNNNTHISTSCNGCSGSCENGCSGSCDGSCSGNCDGCTGGCDGSSCTYM